MRRIVRDTLLAACSLVSMASAGGAIALAQPGGSGATISGKVTCRGVRDCSGAIVFIESLPGRSFPPTPNAVMDQLNLTFVPHVLAVVVGTKVTFPNSDEVRHNLFSPSPVKRFNLGTYPKGVSKYVVFDKPGVVELLCNVHADMGAYVVVTETPYSALVAKDGSYVLKGVPTGTYVVRAWREELKDQRQEVTVSGGTSQTVNFELRR